jgi:pSer/pThr/pTyr-binding forkhead associated (FHA) protein
VPLEQKNFPAIYSIVEPRIAASISDIPVCYIGRSRECHFRLDHPSLQLRHAVIRKSDGTYILESLVNDNSISVNGRPLGNGTRILNGGDRVEILPSIKFVFLNQKDDLENIIDEVPIEKCFLSSETRHHRLRVLSGLVTPQSSVLKEGQTISIGRDPVHPVWINAAFISRLHLTITVYKDKYGITDCSSNGSIVNGTKLQSHQETFFPHTAPVAIFLGPDTELVLSDLDNKKYAEWLKDRKAIDATAPPHESSQFSKPAILENLKQKFSDRVHAQEGVKLSASFPEGGMPSDKKSGSALDVGISHDSIIDEPLSDMGMESLSNPVNIDTMDTLPQDTATDSSNSFNANFEEYQRNQRKKLRDKDVSNFIDPSLQSSMDEYVYESFPASASRSPGYLIIVISAVILLLFAILLFLVSNILI